MNDNSYFHRLKLCNLEVLELRCLPADFIIIKYKILNGVICFNFENYTSLSTMHTTREILPNCNNDNNNNNI